MNHHCNFCFRDENEEMVKHVESANFLCDICDAAFSSERKLNAHKACVIHESRSISRKILIKIEGIKLFKCGTCKLSFIDKETLAKHVTEVHEENKQYKYEIQGSPKAKFYIFLANLNALKVKPRSWLKVLMKFNVMKVRNNDS